MKNIFIFHKKTLQMRVLGVKMKSSYFRIFEDIKKLAEIDVIDINPFSSLVSRVFVPLEKRSSGIGSSLLKEVTDDADKECITLLVDPRPYFDRSREAYKKLIKFYEKAGFKVQKNNYMIRIPECTR